ncbi:MAG: UPF0158 family protein [Bacteroidales bacterium]
MPVIKLNLTNSLLQDIEVALNDYNPESQWYVDIVTSEVLFIPGNFFGDEESENDIVNDLSGRYIPVSARSSDQGWRQMERFILLLDETDENRDRLLDAIIGRNAFSRFKDKLFRMGILEQWYEFKGREDRKEALEWLLENELIEEKDIACGLELYEDWLNAKRKRDADILKMKTGAMVKCIYNAGHEGNIAPGRIYKILGEKEEHLLIRIKDNNGNEKWYPKSHFELLPLKKV